MKFQVSSPGKIILNGEHSVVYGKCAIAGPINLRTYLSFEKTEFNFISINFKSLMVTVSLSLENVKKYLSEVNCVDYDPIEFLKQFREPNNMISKYFKNDEIHLKDLKSSMAFCSTLFLMNRIFKNENIAKDVLFGFALEIGSDIAIGAGCGSSASFGVCLSAGFYVISRLIQKQPVEYFTKEMLEKISEWSLLSEVLNHEKPSGIDNTICTYGELISFYRGQTPKTIKTRSKIDILIVDTKVTRSTSHLVAKVADIRCRYPNILNSIFNTMGQIAENVIEILESEKSQSEIFSQLSELININNYLLRSIGVSHHKLDQIFQISSKYGFSCKLTGAGGGGCAFIILPREFSEMENFHLLNKDLQANGFDITQTSIISGSGVDLKCNF